MTNPSKMSRTAILVEGALMVALAFGLSALPSISLPFGGTISYFSTLPIIVMSLRHSWGWGVGTALVYSVTQLLQGTGNFAYLPTMLAIVLCGLLDYVVAYTCIGLAGPIARRFNNSTTGLFVGIGIATFMRYVCSVFSGFILWGEYAWEGWPVVPYSIAYNALWWVPDTIVLLVAAALLSRIPQLGLLPKRAASK